MFAARPTDLGIFEENEGGHPFLYVGPAVRREELSLMQAVQMQELMRMPVGADGTLTYLSLRMVL